MLFAVEGTHEYDSERNKPSEKNFGTQLGFKHKTFDTSQVLLFISCLDPWQRGIRRATIWNFLRGFISQSIFLEHLLSPTVNNIKPLNFHHQPQPWLRLLGLLGGHHSVSTGLCCIVQPVFQLHIKCSSEKVRIISWNFRDRWKETREAGVCSV